MSYIINELDKKNIFGTLDEIINIIDNNEEIKNKNGHYYFGQGWKK